MVIENAEMNNKILSLEANLVNVEEEKKMLGKRKADLAKLLADQSKEVKKFKAVSVDIDNQLNNIRKRQTAIAEVQRAVDDVPLNEFDLQDISRKMMNPDYTGPPVVEGIEIGTGKRMRVTRMNNGFVSKFSFFRC